MPRGYEKQEPKDYTLFALMDPERKCFYIGVAMTKNTYNAYADHMAQTKYQRTKPMVRACVERGELPHMYALEKDIITKRETAKRQLVWTKYFLSKGCEALDRNHKTAVVDPFPDSGFSPDMEVQYSAIAGKALADICNERTRLHADYRAIRPKRNSSEPTQLNLPLSPDEYQIIVKHATDSGLKPSAYCKKMALEKLVIQYNYQPIRAHAQYVAKLRRTLDNIAFAMIKSGTCYDNDLVSIRSYMRDIYSSECQLLAEMNRYRYEKLADLRAERSK